MEINGLLPIEVMDSSPNLVKYSLNELGTVLTQNEIRNYLGYEPLDDKEITNENESNTKSE